MKINREQFAQQNEQTDESSASKAFEKEDCVLRNQASTQRHDPGQDRVGDGSSTHIPQLSEMIQKAYLAVDEQGTEAAAATGIVFGITSVLADEVTMNCSRPFLYLIREETTGSILFMGHVIDPSKQ